MEKKYTVWGNSCVLLLSCFMVAADLDQVNGEINA